MNKYSIISTIFIIASGTIYTFERITAHLVWAAIRGSVAIHGSGSWPTKPDFSQANNNYFVWAFLVLGVIYLLKKPKNK